MLSEFELIRQYFTRQAQPGIRLALGVGDDCALLKTDGKRQLAISTDMLVEDRHFFKGAEPQALGHKALAVNLSDLAAMGAEPIGFTLALALPSVDEAWLASFSRGLFALAERHQCPLIGGDTTKGPLNLCITVFGEVEPQLALRRDRAQIGDDIWISGSLGDARLALAGYRHELELSAQTLETAAVRMHTPTPRVELGRALLGHAHAAIDISDGLSGDLAHILESSNVGARVDASTLPLGTALQTQERTLGWRFALTGGDDYELCFTAPKSAQADIRAIGDNLGLALTRIGEIEAGNGLRLLDAQGAALTLDLQSFDHFRS